MKYTPTYDLLPDPLQRWVCGQPNRLAAQSTMETACTAVSDSLSCGTYDIDSLAAMYNRITKVTPLMPDLPTVHQPASPNIRFDVSRYDRMLQGVAL